MKNCKKALCIKVADANDENMNSRNESEHIFFVQSGSVQPHDKYLYKIVCSMRALGGVFYCETVDFSRMWSGLYSAFSSLEACENLYTYRSKIHAMK